MNEQLYDVVERSIVCGEILEFVIEAGVTRERAAWVVGHTAWGYRDMAGTLYAEEHPELTEEELAAEDALYTEVFTPHDQITFRDGTVVNTLLTLPAKPGRQASEEPTKLTAI